MRCGIWLICYRVMTIIENGINLLCFQIIYNLGDLKNKQIEMEKFNNKYRIPSARLQNWDYGADAIYFVTICTADHAHYFGTINDGQMQLNDIGMIAHQSWLDIPNYYPSLLSVSIIRCPCCNAQPYSWDVDYR